MSTHDERGACPAEAKLHRFVEGMLEAEAAKDVAEHLEECRDCRFVVRESMAILDQSDDAGLGARVLVSRRRWPAAVAAAAVLAVAVRFFISSDQDRRFDHALARTPVRLTEGRLSGIPYEPYAPRRGDVVGREWRLVALADAVLERTPRRAVEWHRCGVARLVKGDAPQAVMSIEKAAELAPEVATYWSDLAAARIAVGMATNDTEMLSTATSDALRARRLDPILAEARFNIAVSLERRGMLNEARTAYSEYLSVDGRSSWATEARIRIAAIH